MTGLVGKGRAVDIVCLNFIKAFDTLPHKILKDKLIKYGLDEQTVRRIAIWLNSLAQSVVISDLRLGGGQ